MKSVVIFSPNRFSLYTICVTELLKRQGVNVKAIVVRKLFNPKRFLFEFTRDGSRLLKKIWKKLVLKRKAYHSANFETIVDLMKNEKINFSSVDDLCKNYKIPVVYCDNLNDPKVLDLLKQSCPDVVVFTGGGLIRKAILENSGLGVLNCHMGVLPKFRGMDVVEWPLLEGKYEMTGMTVHFMDEGIDTGDILKIKKISISPNQTVKELRDRFEPIMCRELVETCLSCLNNTMTRIPQQASEGKQYFIMHSRLQSILDHKISMLKGNAKN